ncbi:MAG: DUF559 domain-containing protein [Cytophaga sp.]|uniref:DUF559 domain-containing protein n=1 Tax=Cytophaga sp. TaxID=29535 RepID=UPI003F7F66EF
MKKEYSIIRLKITIIHYAEAARIGFVIYLILQQQQKKAIELYFALKRRGVPAEMEKNDGFKTIDIAVPDARVNIEVDGAHHNFNSNQAFSDLNRTLYSFKKGFFTLRIPNSLVRYHLEETADKITEFLIVSKSRQKRNYKNYKYWD